MDGEVVTPQAPSPTLQRRHASAKSVKPRVVAIIISSVCIMIRVKVPIIRMRTAGHIGAIIRKLFLMGVAEEGSPGSKTEVQASWDKAFVRAARSFLLLPWVGRPRWDKACWSSLCEGLGS